MTDKAETMLCRELCPVYTAAIRFAPHLFKYVNGEVTDEGGLQENGVEMCINTLLNILLRGEVKEGFVCSELSSACLICSY